jgi:CPA2 family monovalent cation:H+ antiporter-2
MTLVHVLGGFDWGVAFAVGACLAMSSTLVALRTLEERRLSNRIEGRQVVGVSLLQDLSLAPFMAILAFVLPNSEKLNWQWACAGLVALALMTFVFRAALASRLLIRLQSAQLPELVIAFGLLIALGFAMLSEWLGLGAALGAFTAGLALGGGETRQTMGAAIRPLVGLLAIVFFTSIGLQVDLVYIWANWFLVLTALIVVTVVKVLLTALALRLGGLRFKPALGGGLLLSNVGEFAFVLASAIAIHDENLFRLIVAICALSLALTPLLAGLATRLLPTTVLDVTTVRGKTVVVAGLGPVGRSVVTALREAGIPVLVVDRNPSLLQHFHGQNGIRTHEGKIEDMEDWLPTLTERPLAVILTFPIADASALAAERLRSADPALTIVARCPFANQVDILTRVGVQHVICDETETAKGILPILQELLGPK